MVRRRRGQRQRLPHRARRPRRPLQHRDPQDPTDQYPSGPQNAGHYHVLYQTGGPTPPTSASAAPSSTRPTPTCRHADAQSSHTCHDASAPIPAPGSRSTSGTSPTSPSVTTGPHGHGFNVNTSGMLAGSGTSGVVEAGLLGGLTNANIPPVLVLNFAIRARDARRRADRVLDLRARADGRVHRPTAADRDRRRLRDVPVSRRRRHRPHAGSRARGRSTPTRACSSTGGPSCTRRPRPRPRRPHELPGRVAIVQRRHRRRRPVLDPLPHRRGLRGSCRPRARRRLRDLPRAGLAGVLGDRARAPARCACASATAPRSIPISPSTADALVPLAVPATWEASEMQVMMPASCYWPPPTTQLGADVDRRDPARRHDHHRRRRGSSRCRPTSTTAHGGPSGLSLPYDLVGTFSGSRTRVLTGTLNVVRSAASPVVEPLPIPEPEVVP